MKDVRIPSARRTFLGMESVTVVLFYVILAAVATYPLGNVRISLLGIEQPLYVPAAILFSLAYGLSAGARGAVRRPTVLPVFAVWLIGLGLIASSLVATHESWELVLKYAGFILFVAITAQVIREKDVLVRAWSLLLGAVTFATTVGFVRFVSGTGGIASEHVLGYWGIHYLPSTRNSDALYPLVGLLICIGFATASHGRGARRSLNRTMVQVSCLGVAAYCAVAVILSMSRGAWLAAIAGLTVVSVDGLRRSRALGRMALAATLALGTLVLIVSLWPNRVGALGARWTSIFDPTSRVSNGKRLDLASQAISIIALHPLGVGVGNIGSHLSETFRGYWVENAYLNMAAEAGVLGGLGLCVLVVWPIVSSFRSTMRTEIRQVCLSVSVGTATFLLFNVELTGMLYWTVAGLLAACAASMTGPGPFSCRVAP